MKNDTIKTKASNQTVAVIDIGTSAIRMVIAEVSPKQDIRYLENLHKPIRFGKDVFTNNKISNTSVREAIAILKNYVEVIKSYGVRRVQAIATSAVREASNRDNFIDQVYVRTGLDIEVVEGPEENRLELIAVEHALGDEIPLKERNCLIVEVGSGSTEIIILNKGQVEVTRTISLGSIRLPEVARGAKTDEMMMQRILRRNIRDVASYLANEYSLENIDTFIALGGDMRFVARQLSEKQNGKYAVIDKKAFLNFIAKIAKTTPEEMVSQYGIAIGQAESVYGSLLFYLNFMGETKAQEIFIPSTSIRDGLVLEIAQMLSMYKRTDVAKQVLNSARHLGEKYKYDEKHSLTVAQLAMKLFDQLKEHHGMGSKERLLLEVSAILHDIGSYIAPSSHHKHSSYLVDASDIFGLRKTDKNIVSNVVRYHRRSVPRKTHVAYMSLPKTDRAMVSKLAAILRVADALDHGHQQKIKNFTIKASEDTVTIWVSEECGDITMERHGILKKGDLFSDVFGASIQIKQSHGKT